MRSRSCVAGVTPLCDRGVYIEAAVSQFYHQACRIKKENCSEAPLPLDARVRSADALRARDAPPRAVRTRIACVAAQR